MSQYRLTSGERDLLQRWFYDPYGYADRARAVDGTTLRQALAADPDLDVLGWLNARQAGRDEDGWEEAGLVWWALHNEDRSVRRRPPQFPAWEHILRRWAARNPPASHRPLIQKLLNVVGV